MLYHSIHIRQTPRGEAPLAIRQSWNGLVMLGFPARPGIRLGGVRSGQYVGQTETGTYGVWPQHALEALLDRGQPQDIATVRWWVHFGVLDLLYGPLYFDPECCHRVEGDRELSSDDLAKDFTALANRLLFDVYGS